MAAFFPFFLSHSPCKTLYRLHSVLTPTACLGLLPTHQRTTLLSRPLVARVCALACPSVATPLLTWSQGGVQYVHHGVVVDMGDVYHHPETIHLPHHPLHQGDIPKFNNNSSMSSMKAIHLCLIPRLEKRGWEWISTSIK